MMNLRDQECSTKEPTIHETQDEAITRQEPGKDGDWKPTGKRKKPPKPRRNPPPPPPITLESTPKPVSEPAPASCPKTVSVPEISSSIEEYSARNLIKKKPKWKQEVWIPKRKKPSWKRGPMKIASWNMSPENQINPIIAARWMEKHSVDICILPEQGGNSPSHLIPFHKILRGNAKEIATLYNEQMVSNRVRNKNQWSKLQTNLRCVCIPFSNPRRI
eukprot:GHVP01065743.1.p1 GENE.GHVP01065743.1~~GHVP01065743.1.p1  ORF type:complete len:218 (-),score=30.33 GHVP01065743.1:2991-3644(-)